MGRQVRYADPAVQALRARGVEESARRLLGVPGVRHAVERAFPIALRGDAETRLTRLAKRASTASSEMVLAVGRLEQPRFVGGGVPWAPTKVSVDVLVTSERLIVGKGTSFASYRLAGACARYDGPGEGGDPLFGGKEEVLLETVDGALIWAQQRASRQTFEPDDADDTAPRHGPMTKYGLLSAYHPDAPWDDEHDAAFEQAWALALAATGAVEADLVAEDPVRAGGTVGERPTPRLIRTPRDAELTAAEWLNHYGLGPCHATGLGADEGIDVMSPLVIAQVKMEALPVGRPVLQQTFGVAAVEHKKAAVFALAGFTPQAIEWADRAGVALFQFDFQGQPEPINDALRFLNPPADNAAP